MNFVTYVLSSYQPLARPSVLNHYLYLDPVFGLNFTYPNTVSGARFNTDTTELSGVSGGLFFPWGYPVKNTLTTYNLGEYKGDTTLTIDPANIDETYFTTLKIVYDFGDGSEIINVEKKSVINYIPSVPALDPGTPKDTKVSHVYKPQKIDNISTFFPTISVISSNLSVSVFRLSLSVYADSIFTFNNFHLINSAQLTKADDNLQKSLEILEVSQNENLFVSNFLLISSVPDEALNKKSNREYIPTPTPSPTVSNTPSITPTRTPTCTVTRTVTPTLTINASPTPSVTQSLTPSETPPESPTPTPTVTETPAVTVTISVTQSVTPTHTPVVTDTPTPTPTPTLTPSITVTSTPTETPGITPSWTPPNTQTPTPPTTPSITPSVTPSFTPTESGPPPVSPTPTPSITVSVTPSVTKSPTPTNTPTFTPTNTPTMTNTPTPSLTPPLDQPPGNLWVAGINNFNQLGVELDNGIATSRLVQANGIWSEIVSGDTYSFALSSISPNGYDLYFSGLNTYYQSGLGDNAFRPVYTKVTKPSANNFTKVSTGNTHTLALLGNELWVVGEGLSGQLGFGNTNPVTTWTQVDGQYSDIAAGYGYSLALSTNGRLWVTGQNDRGQLGLGDRVNRYNWTVVNSTVSHNGGTLTRPTFISIYQPRLYSSTYVLSADNRLLVTGRNEAGQLGTNTTNDDVLTFSPINPVLNNGLPQLFLSAYSAGDNFVIGISAGGKLYATGRCIDGQLGLGDPLGTEFVSEWLELPEDIRAMKVSCGSTHSWLLSTNNRACRTGRDDTGQLAAWVINFQYNEFTPLTGTWTQAYAGYGTTYLIS